MEHWRIQLLKELVNPLAMPTVGFVIVKAVLTRVSTEVETRVGHMVAGQAGKEHVEEYADALQNLGSERLEMLD